MASDSDPLNVVGYTNSPPKHSPTFLIPVTVLAVIVTVFFVLYFLLRNLHCYLRRISPSPAATASVDSISRRISPAISTNATTSSAVDSLPLFTFSSITRRSPGGVGGGDCAVCLSKFEQRDLLRLLPLCCHAFHAECIDTWLRSNLTCPLCRSAVFTSDSDVMKFLRSPSTAGGESFRLEIGSVSDLEADGEAPRERMRTTTASSRSRSYSLGSFEYLVDEEAEITLSDARRRDFSGEKEDVEGAESAGGSERSLAGEVASGRSWLKDYVDQLSASISTTLSFRSSGRLFTGSGRRSDVVAAGEYEIGVETNRLGEEISEMFRWLSGV